jgi:hypothetical protein
MTQGATCDNRCGGEILSFASGPVHYYGGNFARINLGGGGPGPSLPDKLGEPAQLGLTGSSTAFVPIKSSLKRHVFGRSCTLPSLTFATGPPGGCFGSIAPYCGAKSEDKTAFDSIFGRKVLLLCVGGSGAMLIALDRGWGEAVLGSP